MGWFSRFSSPKVPRWAFLTGWEDFVLGLREEAQRYGLAFDDAQLADGMIALPETAQYDRWDLRSLATRCRDLEPHEWIGQIRGSLYVAYGRAGDVELVASVPPTARVVSRSVTTVPTTTMQQRLRVQLFGRAYIAAIGLATETVAMRPFGDAWLAVVEDLAGASEATVKWTDLDAAGIDREAAFAIGRANGVADTARHAQTQTLQTTGAILELGVSNAFYLAAVMLETHTRMPPDAVIVACAVTWHHWIYATLERGVATRTTLHAIAELVGKLRDGVSVTAAETIGTSLWWWPIGGEPVVFDPAGVLPGPLAAALG